MAPLSDWKTTKGSPGDPESIREIMEKEERDLQNFPWAPGLATNYMHESDPK